jgi:hypothetical protein
MSPAIKIDEVATVYSASGKDAFISHAPTASLRELVDERCVDVAVMSSEHGLSPLGAASDFLTEALDVPHDEIKKLADWNQFDNESVTLVALKSRRSDSALKGLILAPGETSRCYLRFANEYSRPHRDFYYNVAYESVMFANSRWGARKVGMTHLSASGRFHQDIATCTAEAMVHLADKSGAVVSLVFFGCCIASESLQGICQLADQVQNSLHRPITVAEESGGRVEMIHLSWPHERAIAPPVA